MAQSGCHGTGHPICIQGRRKEKRCASPLSSESSRVVGKRHLGQNLHGRLHLPSLWSEAGFVAMSSGRGRKPRVTVRAGWGCVQEAVIRPGFCQSPGAIAEVTGTQRVCGRMDIRRKDRLSGQNYFLSRMHGRPVCIGFSTKPACPRSPHATASLGVVSGVMRASRKRGDSSGRGHSFPGASYSSPSSVHGCHAAPCRPA